MTSPTTKPTPPTPPPKPPPFTHHHKSHLPLYLLRHGSALIAFGFLFGFIIPLTPYPRLGLTAHIQFSVQGTMLIAAGLVLNSAPFTSTTLRASFFEIAQGQAEKYKGDGKSQEKPRILGATVADRLSPWQRKLVYHGCVGVWATLLSEVANALWGTQCVLPIAHDAAGLKGEGPAARWMEVVVEVGHVPFAVLLATVWPVIVVALFSSD